MAKVLEMKFEAANGKNFTISINDPKPDLTPSDVSSAMETIMNQGVFHVNGSALVSIKQARMIDKTIENLF